MDRELRNIRLVLLSSLCGLLTGTAATLLLHLLDWATTTRTQYPIVIYLLPITGFIIGWVYHTYGKKIAIENALILMGTFLTHLTGGSAGREGTAVKMGASFSTQLSHRFGLTPTEQKHMLIAGTGAGFGAAIGAPIAGMIFGIEVLRGGRLQLITCLECMAASAVAYLTTQCLHAPHTHYPTLPYFPITPITLICVALAAILFGLSVHVFYTLTDTIKKFMSQIHYPPLRPVIGGVILIALYAIIGTSYAGLGIPTILNALQTHVPITVPILKTLATAVTLGTGFKGGEFIPLVFIGTTLGSAFATLLPVPVSLLAATGNVAMFAAASNTPLACTLMAIELFGPPIAPYAALAFVISYYASGKRRHYNTV